MPTKVEQLHPEVAAELENAVAAAWRTADPAMLALCRDRIVGMLGIAPEPEREETLTASERAHVAFAEQFATSVSGLTADQVDALLEHVSPRQAYDFACALYVTEMAARADFVMRATVEPGTLR